MTLKPGMRFRRSDGLCGYEIEEIVTGKRLDVRYRSFDLNTGEKRGKVLSCGSKGWVADVLSGSLIPAN